MRLILIDGNEANVDQTVGVSVYTLNLLMQFKKYASHDIRFLVYLRKEPKLHLPRENQYFRYKVVWGPFAWLRIFLPIQLKIDYAWQRMRRFLRLTHIRFHVFFSPAHYSPSWLPTGCKLVVTIHDLAYEFFPDEFLKKDLHKLHHWTIDSVIKASAVIAVSENTKEDIVRVYNVPTDMVHAIPNGFTPVKVSTPKQTMIINGHDYKLSPYKYLLYIGTLQPRKNISTLIYAFALFNKENPEYKLIIAGKKGWLYDDIFVLTQKLKLESSVHIVGYVTEQEKYHLFNKAFCFVMPSLYEGFGLPILEAFSASCPVICSNTSSLPEVGGNAALYFDPKNATSLLQKLRDLEKDLKVRNELIEKGERQAHKFSWEYCGEATLEVLLK
ncbi:glycosyltransferase family 4 protein [Candidatus Woesebacteria bacterium]|nr:glycosyltransferase family 4 protein [Candidatus Woesebacteria bacterium]